MDSFEVAARIAAERVEKSRQRSQEEYVKATVDYARVCGWVKEVQLPADKQEVNMQTTR